MVLRSLAKDLIPRKFRHELFLRLHRFLSRFSNDLTLTVDEYDGLYPNTRSRPPRPTSASSSRPTPSGSGRASPRGRSGSRCRWRRTRS
ncbi:hypothetical protein RHGRI_013543 [Rhododendron griersonianum]|uniref:Uncharacterized protein n=1 Tax=Rhododendron griersonianum TaxID=479676 RepID=A0AAV6K6A2_9ERIC|nr:hypothetical protein RHGRI_013543 [Rhododendron griersonianum]